MRENLFRAKGKVSNKWYEGLLTRLDEDACNIRDRRHGEWICDPGTVCEYTGLKDRNGNRKYEGDIFQANDGDFIQKYIIRWNDDFLEWSAECIGDQEGTVSLCEFNVNEIDVIGNIFDNPELMRLSGKDSRKEETQPELMPAT